MIRDITHLSPLLSVRPVGAAEAADPGALQPGVTINARVVSADRQGVLLSVGGRTVRMEENMTPRLVAGQVLTLQVLSSSPGSLVLRRLDVGTIGGGPDTVSQMTAVRRDLAAALVSLGVTVDEGNLLAAQALIRFGMAVTAENLSDIRRGVASRAARLSETVALAKSLGLPTSPAILRALDTLLTAKTDPSLLTITVPLRADTASIGAHLQMASRAATRSVESRLLSGDIDGARSDLRSHLLRRAQAGDVDAEAAARHLEGQMLANAARANLPGAESGSLFLAFVAATGSRAHYVEMNIKPDAKEAAAGEAAAATPPETGVAATITMPTTHLGLVTARLFLGGDGRLACRLGTADAEGMRRIERSVGHLNEALVRAGFPAVAARAERVEGGGAAVTETPRAAATQPLRALDLRA